MSLRFRMPALVTSFIGMDLKAGVSIISLFAILNKVAGVYGVLAFFTGGAEWAQLLMYLYSMVSIAGFVLGIKRINEEHGPHALLYAHFYAFDHFFSTIFTALFAVIWYAYTPHDGRRIANSDAQKEMLGEGDHGMDDATREAAAMVVWKGERGFSAAVIVASWFLKIYFIFCMYSFALHLRRGSLPRSKSAPSALTRSSTTGGARYTHLRGASVATIDDGTSGTLAETLWEDDESFMMDEAKSPTAARGTGMTRSASGGVQQLQRAEQTPAVPESPFARILGRLSGEMAR